MSGTDTLARLLRACETGYGCRSAISPKGLGSLTRQGLWHEAAEAILRLDTVHLPETAHTNRGVHFSLTDAPVGLWSLADSRLLAG